MSDSAASPLRGPRQFAVARRMALGIAVLYAVFSTLWIVTSDRLLPVLGGSPEQIAWLGTLKGVLFVLVTSSLIYALLRLAPRTAEKGGIPRTHGLLLAAIFALLAAAILAIGYQVQQHGLRSVEARFFASLRAVTDSKARQVEDWLGAQSRQVTAIATSHAVVDHGPAALDGDPGAHRELVAELQAMAAAFGLDAIAVADALGNPLLAAGRTPDPGLLAPAIAGVYEGYFEGGRPVVVAFSRVPGVDWIVVSAIRMEAALAGAPGLMRNTALVVLVALAVAGWLILALFRQQQALSRVALAHVVRERDLLALIEDVLDISRLQAVDAQLPREATPLKDLILRVASVFQPQATGRGLSLTTRIEPCVAMAEPRRLEQILRNLVGNAVKYTDAGGVTVHCRRVESFVEIAVEDTGPGIGPEELNRLFVPFAQLKRSDSGREGTGLGLAISRRLVEAMGGNIDVDSEPGRGSVFTLRLEAAGA